MTVDLAVPPATWSRVDERVQAYVLDELAGAGELPTRPPASEHTQLLPRPVWPSRPDVVACWDRTWELARAHWHPAEPGLPAPWVDAAFNGSDQFLWDSAFIALFAHYGRNAMDGHSGLFNFYAGQHPDGFLCRTLGPQGVQRWERFAPSSTGPNVLAWVEWELYLATGDVARLAAVWPRLVAYHRWLRRHRTWPSGGYWATGWGCGMDDLPRLPADVHPAFEHGHQTWVDACLQAVLSAASLRRIATVIGDVAHAGALAELAEEQRALTALLQQSMWHDGLGTFVDLRRDGSRSDVDTIAAYWALVADVATPVQAARMVDALQDPQRYGRAHPVPTLPASSPWFRSDGGYWRGAVWAPTTYMVLRGLERAGRPDVAHRLAVAHLDQVVDVFTATGTLWENYSPDRAAPGPEARPDFVGWTGLVPVAVLLEHVFGIRPIGPGELRWNLFVDGEHGVERYPLQGGGIADLRCLAGRADEPRRLQVRTSAPLVLHVGRPGGVTRHELSEGEHEL
jgi:hypothetical protein